MSRNKPGRAWLNAKCEYLSWILHVVWAFWMQPALLQRKWKMLGILSWLRVELGRSTKWMGSGETKPFRALWLFLREKKRYKFGFSKSVQKDRATVGRGSPLAHVQCKERRTHPSPCCLEDGVYTSVPTSQDDSRAQEETGFQMCFSPAHGRRAVLDPYPQSKHRAMANNSMGFWRLWMAHGLSWTNPMLCIKVNSSTPGMTL